MNLGDKIHHLRKTSGMSQEELASQLTISRQAISKWELGESIPDTENVLQLSKLFGVSTDYLLDDNFETNHDALINKPSKETVSPSNGKISNISIQDEPQKPPMLLDITFVLVIVFAVGSILQLPVLFGYSTLGFLIITLQVAAVIYVPVYLFIIRPRSMKYPKAKANIRKSTIMSKVFWGAGTSVALLSCFLLCKHIFHVLHNNTEWPITMFLLGFVVILIAAFLDARKVMVCAVTGYVVSFITGLIFNYEYDFIVDGVVQSRNYTAWIIWTVLFLVIIVVSTIWEVISRRRLSKTLAV